MSNLEEEVKGLRNTIFNMLNFTNMYILVLDCEMQIKFANNSLAMDLGFKNYTEIIGKSFLEFIEEKNKEKAIKINYLVANGISVNQYREINGEIIGNKGKLLVTWFNSHISSDLKLTFAFGVRKEEEKCMKDIHCIRTYYRDIIEKDKAMISSMQESIGLCDNVVKSCEPNFFMNKGL
jgi:hypothetical protein